MESLLIFHKFVLFLESSFSLYQLLKSVANDLSPWEKANSAKCKCDSKLFSNIMRKYFKRVGGIYISITIEVERKIYFKHLR